MIDWYLNLSITHRAIGFILLVCFCVVMSLSFRSLTRSKFSTGWYRGVQSTPIFQILMWLGAIPLLFPGIILFFRRKRALASAPFIGNLQSRIYHTRACDYQRRIYSNFVRFPFQTAQDAEDRGFRSCNWCKPKTY